MVFHFMEQTLVLLRPDALRRRICGEIIAELEQEGQIQASKVLQLTREQMHEHYAHILGKPFYQPFEDHMLSGPSMALVLEGEGVIEGVRRRIGSIDQPGTLRGRFAKSVSHNVIHGSDNPDGAEKEMQRFFTTEELRTVRNVVPCQR